MRPLEFFATHPIFTHAEFAAVHAGDGARSPHTSNNILAWYVATDRLLRIHRGLYAVVPRGIKPERMPIDPYLVASKLADDAVVGYHAALQFHGKTYSIWRRYHYLTRAHRRPFSFRQMEFIPARVPGAIGERSDLGGHILTKPHADGTVRVTTLERSLVDVLDIPAKGGGWEEIWRSLEMIEFFDLDAVIDYAIRLGSALTIARVGWFLEFHRDALMVDDEHLARLRAYAPTQPRYLDGSREPGRLIRGWNLIVPNHILHRAWEETSE